MWAGRSYTWASALDLDFTPLFSFLIDLTLSGSHDYLTIVSVYYLFFTSVLKLLKHAVSSHMCQSDSDATYSARYVVL